MAGKKVRNIILLLSALLFTVGLCLIVWAYQMIYAPAVKIQDGNDVCFIVDKNDRAADVLHKIQSLKCVKNTDALEKIMLLKKYDRNIHPGYYKLENGMSNNEIVNKLRSGLQSPVRLTFNNVRTKEDFAAKISRQLQFDSITLYRALQDDHFIEKYGLGTQNVLSLFIPDTYEMYYTASVNDFFKRMHKEYNRFWNESRLEKLQKIGISQKEVSILASIIDEETNKNDEKPIIAGVYLNRLTKGILLQADPTLKFAWSDFTIKRVLDKHKKIDSPYNTYKYAGLPPGVIRQPSVQAIDAVLNYEKHDYLYFCAKDDFSGYHVFARTLVQHNRNADKYHRALNNAKIYK